MSIKDYLVKMCGITEKQFDDVAELRTAEFLFVKSWAIRGCLNCLYHMGKRIGKGE